MFRLIKFRNFDCLIQKSNAALEELSTWLKANGLLVNTKKTNFLMFSNRNYGGKKFEIYFNPKVLSQEKSTKFLGIVVDDKLNWKNHSLLILFLESCLEILELLINYGIINKFYNTLIQPYLFYGNIVWGSTYHSNFQKLVYLQKKGYTYHHSLQFPSTYINLVFQTKHIKVPQY